MHRAMNPPLQTPFLVCLALLVLSSSSSMRLMKAHGSPTIVPDPGCLDHCGNVRIPFPFGIGVGCFLDDWFEIQCDASTNKPFLPKLYNLEVMDITIPNYNGGWIQSLTVGIPSLYSCGAHNNTKQSGINLRGSPYSFSTDKNVFFTEGCPGSTSFIDHDNEPVTGCSTACRNKTDNRTPIPASYLCDGDVSECCLMDLPSEQSFADYYSDFSYPFSRLQLYKIGFYGGESAGEKHNCLAATLIKTDSVSQYIGKLSTSNRYESVVPVLLYWSWVIEAWPNPKPNARCWRDETTYITYCSCHGNSAGNPYVKNGCKHIAKCKYCRGMCTWNQKKSSYFCKEDNPSDLLVEIVAIFSIGSLAIAIVFGCRWLFRAIRRRRKIYRRVMLFKLKLQQHQSSNESVVERTKLFTHKKLDKATDHFNENRILGRGGQGTVYKGMLDDGTIVAIKKSSKLEDESQMEQFINEVVILSTINHRNVVKLLGCCLETKVPLLVYEYVSNGTLSQHIHNPSEDFVLTWTMRLKIAADSAGAIAYLHSSSSTPVYHRDIKPANILLDDKFRAKVSDFGSSKMIRY